MTMNSRKMNNYSIMRISAVLVLAVILVTSTFAFPMRILTSAAPISNNPPYVPFNPGPANGSTNVSINTDLNWTGGDPDNDTVTYDVYFGPTNPPVNIAINHTTTIFLLGSLNYSTIYYWRIIAWDNHSNSTIGPLWLFTTEPQPNSPPSMPGNENPVNQSTNVALNAILTWTGGDPDNDTVTYDVFFGTTSSPPVIVHNQSALSYTPEGLTYNQVYYWRIVAWDEHNASTTGPLWHFSTLKQTTLSVTITKPIENKFYFNDAETGISLPSRTIVYGKITIVANVTSDTTVSKVEFYADGKKIGEATAAPYTCLWRPIIQFKGLSLKRTIKVIVYDSEGHNASDELNITKWRFHPLPFILAGMAIASTLVTHTKIRGLVFNFKESKISVSFYAIRVNYRTVGPFKLSRGVISLKQCIGGFLIGPSKMVRFGPFHKFAYGTFTFVGNVHYDTGLLGQGLLTRLLQPRTNAGNLFKLLRGLTS